MTAEDADSKQIEALRGLFRTRLKLRGGQSVFFSFTELARAPLFADEMGSERLFKIVSENSGGKITYRIKQVSVPVGQATSLTMDYDPKPPVFAPPQAIGIEVHVADPDDIDSCFEKILNRPIRLSEHSVEFDHDIPAIVAAGRASRLPPARDEYELCIVMFKVKIAKPVDWSEVYEEMTGNDPLERGKDRVSTGAEIKRSVRKVQDTVYAVNERIARDLNTADELFSWKNKSVIRNY